MQIKKIIEYLNLQFLPFIQEHYDNSGSQILFPNENINSIMIALDVDEFIVEEAIAKKVNLIITHHPLFFKPISSINMEEPISKFIVKLINHKVSVYAAHTNLDKLFYYYLGEKIGFKSKDILLKDNKNENYGFGSIANIENPILFGELLKITKKNLDIDFLIYSGDKTKRVSKIAFINGAGGNSIEKIIKNFEIDCIITGDVGYHSVKFAEQHKVFIIDAGHFGTERIFKKIFKKNITEFFKINNKESQIYYSETEKNPFKVYQDE